MSMIRYWLQPCRWGWVVLALFVVLAPIPGASQAEPGPRPQGNITFYDEDGLFSQEERSTLARDADLLQSTDIPILVYVRVVTAREAQEAEAQAFADAVRREWDIRSAPDADDGLVLLFSWVAQDPTATTAVYSSGDHTFDDSGLTASALDRTISRSVNSLIEQEQPFEALVYLMRETRYTGIYAPPPPAPLDSTVQAVHDTLRWLAPALALAAMVSLATLTTRFWKVRPDQRVVWTVIGVTLAWIAALWGIAVYAKSEAGIVAALGILAALGITAWTWSRLRFTRHGSAPVRRRAVPATVTLMRQRRQARLLLDRETGGLR